MLKRPETRQAVISAERSLMVFLRGEARIIHELCVHNIDLSIHRIAKGEEITAAIDAAKASGAEGSTFRRHRSSSLIVANPS
jgi:hypothetical protein